MESDESGLIIPSFINCVTLGNSFNLSKLDDNNIP